MLHLHIKNNGVLERTLLLEQGSHTIGREQADIVLTHAGVSKEHALLTLQPDGVTISDSNSTNGIFWNGNKIREKTFKQDFEIEIGPFILQGIFEGKQTPRKYQRLVEKIALINMKLTLCSAISSVIILTFAAVFFPLSISVASFQHKEILKRGRMYAKYLADANKTLLVSGSASVDLITAEENILYAYIVDESSKILAPEEKAGTFFDMPEARAALLENKEKSTLGNNGEAIFIYPVKVGGAAKGAAVVGCNAESTATSGLSIITVYANLILIALLAAGLYLAFFLHKLFSMPLQKLDEDVNIAIKQRKQHLNFISCESAVNSLVATFNRLLFMNAAPREKKATEQGIADLPAVSHTPCSHGAESGLHTLAMGDLVQLESPWCTINMSAFTIEQYNRQFVDVLCCSKIRQGMHLLEGFDNPQILKSISSVLDEHNKEDEKITASAGKTYCIRKTAVQDNPAVALLILEDAAHE